MSNLINGQTINSYAMERIKEKAWLNSVDDNKWDGLPIVRKRKSTLNTEKENGKPICRDGMKKRKNMRSVYGNMKCTSTY
mgnify:CR=1 FL=1